MDSELIMLALEVETELISVASDVDSEISCDTLTASSELTPAATPESVRSPCVPAKLTVVPMVLAPTESAPVDAFWLTRPNPDDATVVDKEEMLVDVEVDSDVSCDMFTASVGLTPAAKPERVTPPVPFDTVRMFPVSPPGRK
ncbi:hypothetical protein WN982_14100 [Paraburkholderia sp. IMGN_8]